MNTSPNAQRVIYFGSSAESARLLEAVLASDFCQIVAVVTRPEPRQGHRSQADTPVAKVAQAADLPLFRPQHPDEIIPEITRLEVTAGLLFAYGKLLSEELIAAFDRGIVNVHPSLLPRYRGPSPIEATILSGDDKAGTTIMLITKDMDAGPILKQVRFSIDPHIGKSELWEQLYAASLAALREALPQYLAGKLSPQPQAPTGATYCKLLRKSDGQIDVRQESAETVERKVRAYADWPRVRVAVRVNGKPTELTLHAVAFTSEKTPDHVPSLNCVNGQALLSFADGVLEIQEAQLAGRKQVTGRDLCNLPSLELAISKAA